MERVLLYLLGLCTGIVIGLPMGGAVAEPGHDEASHIEDAEVQCRGNGPGGYRKCMIRFERPAKKVAVDIYVGDEFDVGFIWRPDKVQ